MSEIKHTPGPWAAKPNLDYPSLHVIWNHSDELPTMIARTCYSLKSDANAALIAAAPDLLDALQRMVNMYVELVNSGDAGYWNPEETTEVIAARAAIAKATTPNC